MQVTCSCGKVLNVPEKLAGKSARCPACKKILQMPGEAPPGSSPSRIVLECSCGKKLAAPAAAAGKTVRCPKCGQDLTVPGGAKAPPAPAIVPMPGPQSQKVKAPTRSRTLTPPASESPSFDVLAPPPEMPEPPAIPDASPAGQAAKAQYGLGNPTCPNCKAELPYGAQFCVECGTSLATGAKIKPMAKAGVKKRRGWSDLEPYEQKRIIYAIIAIAVAGFFYWWFTKPGGMTPEDMRRQAQQENPGKSHGAPRGGPASSE